MTDTGPAAQPPAINTDAAMNFAKGLLSFEKLIGSTLVKIVYYVGLAGIALAVLVAIAGSMGAIQYSPGMSIFGLLMALLGGAISVVMWRFVCELWLLAFMIYARMGEIRDRLPPR